MANNLYFLAGSLEQSGRLTEAEQSMRRCIAILEKIYGSDAPPLGLALGRLASVESQLAKNDLARETRSRESAIRQRSSGSSAVRAGGAVSTPRVISKQEPKYTEKARRAKIQGTIMLSLVVDKNGEPADITVLLPLGEGLDEKAIESVKAWRFQPATKDGEPVRVQATIQVNFRLL